MGLPDVDVATEHQRVGFALEGDEVVDEDEVAVLCELQENRVGVRVVRCDRARFDERGRVRDAGLVSGQEPKAQIRIEVAENFFGVEVVHMLLPRQVEVPDAQGFRPGIPHSGTEAELAAVVGAGENVVPVGTFVDGGEKRGEFAPAEGRGDGGPKDGLREVGQVRIPFRSEKRARAMDGVFHERGA